jgi:hypothetical protein
VGRSHGRTGGRLSCTAAVTSAGQTPVSVRLYMDVHIPAAITEGLRLRGVEVLTAQEDGRRRLPDDKLLDRATELGHVLFTQDDDLLREASERQRHGAAFAGIIYAHQIH